MKSKRWKILSLIAASPLMGFCIATGQGEPQAPRVPRSEIRPSESVSETGVRTLEVDAQSTADTTKLSN